MEVEHKEYTGKAQGNFNSVGAAAGIASFLGINANNVTGGRCGCCGGGDSQSAPINRYEAELQQKISSLQSALELRDANTYTMQEMNKLRDYVDAKFDKFADRTDARFSAVDARLCAQAEWNAAQTGAIACIKAQMEEFYALTKRIVPITSVCPQPMPQYNSWTAPAAPTAAAA